MTRAKSPTNHQTAVRSTRRSRTARSTKRPTSGSPTMKAMRCSSGRVMQPRAMRTPLLTASWRRSGAGTGSFHERHRYQADATGSSIASGCSRPLVDHSPRLDEVAIHTPPHSHARCFSPPPKRTVMRVMK